MFRIFSNTKLQINNNLKIDDEQTHHLFNVLRMKPGDKIEVVDISNKVFIAELGTSFKFNIIDELGVNSEPKVDITIFQGLPKRDKFELIIKMGTEIGAKRFIPVEMKRSIVKVKPERVSRLVDRWNKIALSASKQSKRQEVPLVEEPITFKEMIDRFSEFDLVICFHATDNQHTLRDVVLDENIKNIALIIGPEGGIAREEVNYLRNTDATFCSLGKRIMRTETAGIVALSILLYLAGDI